jgi:hypothetical protein
MGNLISDIKGEHRQSLFQNRMLRRIFGPKRDELTRGWKKLHNEDLNNLYSAPNIIKMINRRSVRWAGYLACI